MVILAPVVVIPLSATSQSALVADLGRLKVKNTFLHASSVAPSKGESGSIFYAGKEFSPRDFISSSGQKAIVDRMSVKLSSIQLGRYVNFLNGTVYYCAMCNPCCVLLLICIYTCMNYTV